jgi:hypothetical protein
MALAPFADFYHNSNGIPAVTKGLGRGTKNDCPNSHILHWATSKQAYNVIQGAKERGLITHSPLVIASNLTTATASGEPVEGNYHILQALGSNRRNGSGVRYGSYGRESMANTNLPNDIKNLGPDMEYKERCARCSICSEPLIDQGRAGGCVKNPVVQGIYRAHNRAKRQLAK